MIQIVMTKSTWFENWREARKERKRHRKQRRAISKMVKRRYAERLNDVIAQVEKELVENELFGAKEK